MASATVALGNFVNRPASGSTVATLDAGRGGRNLVENTLDPDSSLVSRCMRGEETAWEDLVRLHTRRVYGLCYRFTGSGSEAIAQAIDSAGVQAGRGARGGGSGPPPPPQSLWPVLSLHGKRIGSDSTGHRLCGCGAGRD